MNEFLHTVAEVFALGLFLATVLLWADIVQVLRAAGV